MRKVYLTLFVMMLATASVFAQAQVGLRAGANWATVIRDQSPPAGVETPWRPGFMIGVASSFGAGETFSIAPELIYSQRGNNWNDGGVSSSSRYNFMELPVMFRLSFGDVLGGYINAGPSFSYLLGGKGYNEAIDFGQLDEAKRWEIGGALGGGVKLNTGAGTFLIDLRYTRGFSDTFFRDFTGNQEAKHQLITTSLIFLMPSVR